MVFAKTENALLCADKPDCKFYQFYTIEYSVSVTPAHQSVDGRHYTSMMATPPRHVSCHHVSVTVCVSRPCVTSVSHLHCLHVQSGVCEGVATPNTITIVKANLWLNNLVLSQEIDWIEYRYDKRILFTCYIIHTYFDMLSSRYASNLRINSILLLAYSSFPRWIQQITYILLQYCKGVFHFTIFQLQLIMIYVKI